MAGIFEGAGFGGLVQWNGEMIEKKIVDACIKGVDQTMSEAAAHAKNTHPWRNRTGVLEGSIRPVAQAQVRGAEIVGVWGSASVLYAAFLELGTSKMRARPFLRPAADAVYPRLIGKIKRYLGFAA
ncbi:MAG: HK97-gp10 family putative phage morphogenesis protein [bacterium]